MRMGNFTPFTYIDKIVVKNAPHQIALSSNLTNTPFPIIQFYGANFLIVNSLDYFLIRLHVARYDHTLIIVCYPNSIITYAEKSIIK